jgi:general secretion pathway protein N
MTRGRIVALALVVYVIALIATAPAAFVDSGFASATEGRIRLAVSQGTIWAGSGQIVVLDARGHALVIKELAWRVLPASLWRARIECDVELDRSARSFPVMFSLTRITISGADIILPAAVLALVVPQFAPLELGGELAIRVANASIGRGDIQGNATVRWRAATSALTRVAPLGDYELRIEEKEGALYSVLRTLQGPLELTGNATWRRGESPKYSATARIPERYRQDLEPLMRLIGAARGDGSFDLSLN